MKRRPTWRQGRTGRSRRRGRQRSGVEILSSRIGSQFHTFYLKNKILFQKKELKTPQKSLGGTKTKLIPCLLQIRSHCTIRKLIFRNNSLNKSPIYLSTSSKGDPFSRTTQDIIQIGGKKVKPIALQVLDFGYRSQSLREKKRGAERKLTRRDETADLCAGCSLHPLADWAAAEVLRPRLSSLVASSRVGG